MESWSYVSGANVMSNEAISSSDSFAQRKMPWWAGDSKTPYSFGNNMLVSDQPAIDGQGLGELGYQDLVGKQLPETSTRDVLSSKIDGGKFISPFGGAPTAFSLEDESTSRLSSSIVDSNSKESSFIHLQLGRFGDPRDGQSSRISRGPPIVSSSSESSMPLKRAKMGVNSYTAYCQVYGCNKDLSSSKDYHKRHRVCEVHSKTAKVIVNGIEQRFCQQCSRFHLLAEFDDGKRSCRKRLAGHNERRRKPQVGFHSGRNSRLFQINNCPCAGYESGRFHSPALTATSFICPDILPNGLLHPEKYKTNEWSRSVKVGGGTHFGAISAVPISSGNLPMKLLFPAKNFNEVCPHYHDNGANNTIGNNFSDSTNHFLHMGAPDANSRWLLQDSPLENEEFPAFDAASTMQGQSEITDVGCALSLLSSQSHNSSSHSSGIPLACPMVVPGSYTHYSVTQVSERLMGVNSRTSTNVVSNKFSSQGMSSAEASHLEPMLISDSNEAINFNIIDGMYQGSHFVNARDHLGCEDGATINLLQLSSQLQLVECEKQSMHVKQKRAHTFCFPSIT